MGLRKALPLLFMLASPVPAQVPGDEAERVELSDLLLRPAFFHDRMVMVTGELRSGDIEDSRNEIYQLREPEGFRSVRLATSWRGMSDLRFQQGRKVEVLGIFWDLTMLMPRDPRLRRYPPGVLRPDVDMGREENRYFIGAESVDPVDELPEELTPEPPAPKRAEPVPKLDLPPAEILDLRELVRAPDSFSGRRVTVVGKFRGDNLYGDLSIRTKKTPRDFVLKVAEAAIWVTGKRPRGEDFELNPKLRRDTGKWLKVSGEPSVDKGVVYLKADSIEVVPQPEDPALEPRETEEEPVSRKPPPEVTFSLPMDGERRIPPETEFRVQFSKDMKESSFDRNVDLLYAEDPGRGNPFPDIEISYDRASRTLMVNPGRPLEPGKEIRLILYEGIVDTDGLALASGPGAGKLARAPVVLSFFTASASP